MSVPINTVHAHIREGTSDQEMAIRHMISHTAKEARDTQAKEVKVKHVKAKEAKARVKEARADLRVKRKGAASLLLIPARASIPPASRRLLTQDQ